MSRVPRIRPRRKDEDWRRAAGRRSSVRAIRIRVAKSEGKTVNDPTSTSTDLLDGSIPIIHPTTSAELAVVVVADTFGVRPASAGALRPREAQPAKSRQPSTRAQARNITGTQIRGSEG
jgi:hypothetical protein